MKNLFYVIEANAATWGLVRDLPKPQVYRHESGPRFMPIDGVLHVFLSESIAKKRPATDWEIVGALLAEYPDPTVPEHKKAAEAWLAERIGLYEGYRVIALALNNKKAEESNE